MDTMEENLRKGGGTLTKAFAQSRINMSHSLLPLSFLVLKKAKYEHIIHLLKTLHWLPKGQIQGCHPVLPMPTF